MQGKPKKIKTESGVWISASYKTDRYKKWIEKSRKLVDKESDDEDDDEVNNKSRKGSKNNKMKGLYQSSYYFCVFLFFL